MSQGNQAPRQGDIAPRQTDIPPRKQRRGNAFTRTTGKVAKKGLSTVGKIILIIIIILVILIIIGVVIFLLARRALQNRCINDAGCSGATPKCNVASGQCVQCLAPEDCTLPDICDPNTFQCISLTCTSDADCSGSLPHCNVMTGVCVECTEDPHCDPGFICNNGLCMCSFDILNMQENNPTIDLTFNEFGVGSDYRVLLGSEAGFEDGDATEILFNDIDIDTVQINICDIVGLFPGDPCLIGSSESVTIYFRASRNGGCSSPERSLTFGPLAP